MRRKLLPLVLVAVLIGSAEAQTGQTPRERWDEVQSLFAQGHRFTADEAEALDELQRSLVSDGDTELAADLELLRLAAQVRNTVEETREQAVAGHEDEAAAWEERERFTTREQAWRATRNGALVGFSLSIVSTLLLGVIIDADENLLKNGYYDDYQDRKRVIEGLRWAMGFSAGGALVSLFPLLWAEARQ